MVIVLKRQDAAQGVLRIRLNANKLSINKLRLSLCKLVYELLQSAFTALTLHVVQRCVRGGWRVFYECSGDYFCEG